MPDWLDGDELRLIREAQRGDGEAFGQLYDHYAPQLFRFLYAHLDDRLDAEDLTEDVFLRVWKSLPQYQEQGIPFAAYIFRIARNALIDHYRRNRRNPPVLSLEDDFVRDVQPGPSEVTIANMERQEVRDILAQLRDEYRQVLDLRFLSELSPDETAAVMGKSAGAVRVLQHRALAALRKIIGS